VASRSRSGRKSEPAELVLASGSEYRRVLLGRLGLRFVAMTPACDETPRPGEAPETLVARLAQDKARSLADVCSGALIIGSDQVGVFAGEVLTKPGTHERATAQLARLSGGSVRFLTGLCLLNTVTANCQVAVEAYTVNVRPLSRAMIENYLRKERPYDCAGAFKAEGLGIALFTSMSGEDPTSLIGLPLIRLVDFLAAEGISPLASPGNRN
jgi:septum formation protein